MAAQEKAKLSTPAPTPTAKPTVDLLDAFDDPTESATAPPPPFDVSLLPPQKSHQQASAPTPPPPAFDDSLLPPAATSTSHRKSSQSTSVTWDPSIPAEAPPPLPPSFDSFAPPAASAPIFEDLLDAEEQKLPPPAYLTPVEPPSMPTQNETYAGLDQEAIDTILGIEGLSDEEKAAMIAEQEKIMESIELEKRNKTPDNAAFARADAFEQRSHAAAVQAIGGGIGSTKVSPVSTAGDPATAASLQLASQMAADMELAEQLQKEEYKKEEKRQAKAAAAASAKEKASSSTKQSSASAQSSSWMDWLGFGSTTASTASTEAVSPDRSFAQRPLERGEIGVSLPPGASRNNVALAMAPAYTGQEDDDYYDDVVGRERTTTSTIQFSSSRDEAGDENAALMGGGAARVAKKQPLFSCVADSISSAANSLYLTASTDGEGNVHGVDSSGLLAISQAGRGGGDGDSSANGGGGGYHNMGSSTTNPNSF